MQLGKLPLYQLSYTRKSSAETSKYPPSFLIASDRPWLRTLSPFLQELAIQVELPRLKHWNSQRIGLKSTLSQKFLKFKR